MPTTFSYADAVRLLGGKGPIAKTIEQLMGGAALVGAVTGAPALLNLIQARTDFVTRGHHLVRGVVEKRTGLSRYTRTQRLEAAHAVLVMVAYFEAFDEADLPLSLADLELTKDEQARLATGPTADLLSPLTEPFLRGGLVPLPILRGGPSVLSRTSFMSAYYRSLSQRLSTFMNALAVVEGLDDRDRRRLHTLINEDVPERAFERYKELFRQLAVEVPELEIWAAQHEHAATRAEVRELADQVGRAMAGLERRLAGAVVGSPPDHRRAALARAHRAELERPIVSSGEVPEGLRLPTLDAGYLAPQFRIGVATGEAALSDESWWVERPVRIGLEGFLASHLTSSRATEAPLLVLGQPGSGKSVLTKVLAARLPAEDFLPVRVVLRDVSATADLQAQIESAVRSATGESLDWPELARSAGDALPVVILDGFDELLQATGVAHTDYLARVAEFQRREAVQGRPVAVIVTSRTSVADRARPPSSTIVLRLEPFDDGQVAAWVSIWNEVNEASFRERGIDALSETAVQAHPALAGQPLLLLMLALYDADENALQRAGKDLRQDQLYERLLQTFARREVGKHRPGLPERERDLAVERELRDLSVVAFAMFNRGSQWATESDLNTDLPVLFPDDQPPSRPGQDLRAPLRVGERLLGRFFFVHRSQATRDESTLETYEFLHATFGEFLVARLTWRIVRGLVERERAATFAFSASPVNDDLLHALLSFAVLSRRIPVIYFLRDLSEDLGPGDKLAATGLLTRLFRTVHQPRSSREYAGYQPRRIGVPRRHAAYAANLVLLTACITGSVRVSELYGTDKDADPIPAWRNEAMLWRSQFDSEEWQSVVEAFEPIRLWSGEETRDLELRMPEDGAGASIFPIDPYWSAGFPEGYEVQGVTHLGESMYAPHRSAQFICDPEDDLILHGIEPLLQPLGPSVAMVAGLGRGEAVSVLHTLLAAWVLPVAPSLTQTAGGAVEDPRRDLHLLLTKVVNEGSPLLGNQFHSICAALLLHRLTTDDTVPPSHVVDILQQLTTGERKEIILQDAANDIVRCGLEFLGRDQDSDPQLKAVIRDALEYVSVEEARIVVPYIDPILRQRAKEALREQP